MIDFGSTDELPEGWTSASILDFADLVRGVSYSKGEAKYEPADGLVALLRANNISDELNFDELQHVPEARVSQEQLLKTGDVVVAMSSGSKSVVGKGAQFKCRGTFTFGAFCGVLRPFKGIDAGYFGFFFKSKAYRNAISEASAGTNINNLKREYFGKIEIPLSPLAEQKRIVAKVEMLLAHVNTARQRLAKVPMLLKRFRQSVLAAACSGQLTEDWRTTYEGTLDGWQTCQIGDLFKVTTGGTPSRKKPAFFRDGTVPWVKTGEVRNCDIFSAEEHITEEAIENSSAKVFPAGTLLVALYGEGKTRGQIGRLMIDAATNQACAALVNREMDPTTNRYVFLFLLGQYFDLRERSAGGNQPNLSVGLIREWEISVPPLAEQHEIVRRVEALFARADRIEKQLAAATRRVETLTQAILAQAFRGDLVPTEAELARAEGREYEPASVLLERIQKAR